MNTIFKIFYKTNDTLDYLGDQYNDDLNLNCDLIFMIVGAIGGLDSYFKDVEHFKSLIGSSSLVLIF
jgi:hypothetical protein